MSLINTRLLNFRAQTGLDRWETRAGRWGGYNMFRGQSMPGGIVTDDLKTKAISAVGSTLQIPVIDYDADVTISNVTQPLVVVGSPSTSQLFTVSFTQYYWGFLIHPAQHFNNEISMQREFNEQMTKHIYKFIDDLDVACIAALEAAKTQVLADTLGGRYALVGNVIEGALAEKDAMVGDFNPLMSGNNFFGALDVVTNGSMESHVRNNLLEKGEFQSENKTYQYNDKTWHFSNNIANAVGHRATAFGVQKGSVGMVQQFLPDNVMGNSTHKHRWDIDPLPIAGLPIGTYFYDDAVDGSALGGAATAHLTATKAQAHGFHTAIALLTPYNSDPATIASAVAKFAIKTT